MYVNLSCFWTVHLEAPGIGKYVQLVHEVCSQNTGAKLGSYNYLSLFYTSAFQKQNLKQLVTFFQQNSRYIPKSKFYSLLIP